MRFTPQNPVRSAGHGSEKYICSLPMVCHEGFTQHPYTSLNCCVRHALVHHLCGMAATLAYAAWIFGRTQKKPTAF